MCEREEEEGRWAAFYGEPVGNCPYDYKSRERRSWLEGYYAELEQYGESTDSDVVDLVDLRRRARPSWYRGNYEIQ